MEEERIKIFNKEYLQKRTKDKTWSFEECEKKFSKDNRERPSKDNSGKKKNVALLVLGLHRKDLPFGVGPYSVEVSEKS